MEYYAHEGQSLVEHLRAVANFASRFASYFDAREHGCLAGLLHDLGKAEHEFQKRIALARDGKGEPKELKRPHAHHGASLLLQPDPERGGPVWPAAFAINGHHAGLHNRSDLQKRENFCNRALAAEKRLSSEHPEWDGTMWPIRSFGENLPDWLDRLPFVTIQERNAKMRAADLYTRFLFSALVDADRLDTEQQAPETKDNFSKRHTWRFGEAGLASDDASEALLRILEDGIRKRKEEAKSKEASTDVLEVRETVLGACASAAKKPRGVFTLTVPTGGGKTLASVYFALKHIAHQTDPYRKLRRIIVVIPYLNIIHQTVQELKDVFQHSENDPIVLEHHSQAKDPEIKGRENSKTDKDTDGYRKDRSLRQLAAENWDAPIVVTTSVQFFDSLFSRRPSDARKLHNIAHSVVIFDEVQTLPPLLMQPILDVLGELTNADRPYGCSLVLCTATQPALLKSDDLPCGFENVQPIVEYPAELFRRLKRTTYPELESKAEIPQLTWEQLALDFFKALHHQGLVVVNTRRQARTLFSELRKSETHQKAVFHLSTWMTPAHRIEVLDEVRRRLDTKQPCFLVSTQCIEAGVDVDFPAVWRALGPYDSIVQAAGRCNRNGRLEPEDAQVHVFRTEDEKLPPGVYQTATNQTELLRRMNAADPNDPESFERYFRLLYQLTVPDECEIQRERQQLHFEQVNGLFNLIESFSVPIIVAEYELDESRVTLREMCEQAAQKGFLTPTEWQEIQPHIVQLDYRDKKTAQFNRESTMKLFREDDELTGLRRLTHISAYKGGLRGCGLDIDQVGSFENMNL